MNNKFKVGEPVLYKNGDTYQLGIIKEIIEPNIEEIVYNKMCSNCPDSKYCHEECVECDEYINAITDPASTDQVYKYRVWYHTGDTTAVTPEDKLYKIMNRYAFTILRHQTDVQADTDYTCRNKAIELLAPFRYYGDMYYKLEEWFTQILEGYTDLPPSGLDSSYLENALRVELDNIFTDNNIDVDDHTIDKCVQKILKHKDANVLNTDIIFDVVTETTLKLTKN